MSAGSGCPASSGSASGGSVLLLGESGVGKTHYGAQLLNRLMKGDGCLRMDGQATNLEPFEAAMERLNEGKAADHTPTSTFVDSVWPVVDAEGRQGELVWPDYGGEQIKNMIASRRVPNAWRERARQAPAWLLLVRLQQTRVDEDIFSRPLADLRGTPVDNREVRMSDQARLVELLQMLVYASGAATGRPLVRPRLGVLLTCWDELGLDTAPDGGAPNGGVPGSTPTEVLATWLPMLSGVVRSTWQAPSVMGLSALGRALDPRTRDMDYASIGPEHFGYVVQADGARSSDLTLPLQPLLYGCAEGRS